MLKYYPVSLGNMRQHESGTYVRLADAEEAVAELKTEIEAKDAEIAEKDAEIARLRAALQKIVDSNSIDYSCLDIAIEALEARDEILY